MKSVQERDHACVLQMAETENQGESRLPNLTVAQMMSLCILETRHGLSCRVLCVPCWIPILLWSSLGFPFSSHSLLSKRGCLLHVLEVYNLMVDVTVTQSWEYALRWEGIWIRTFKQCWESLDSEPLHIELNAFDIMRWPWTFGNVLWVCRVDQRLMCLTILFPACDTVLVGTLFPNLSSCVTYNFA